MPSIQEMARQGDEVVTSEPHTGVVELARIMEREGVGCVVVVEEGRPVGIVTDRDVTLRVVAEDRDASELTAADVMTEDLYTASVGDEISDVIRGLGEKGVRRLPIVDDDGVAGIITLDDIVVMLAVEQKSISAELDSVSNVIRSESPPY